MTRTLNKRTDRLGSEAIYVGRPTKWGNPFVIGRDGTRAEVIARYEEWALRQPRLIADARAELAGHDLICWCSPLPCHADVLRRIAAGEQGGTR